MSLNFLLVTQPAVSKHWKMLTSLTASLCASCWKRVSLSRDLRPDGPNIRGRVEVFQNGAAERFSCTLRSTGSCVIKIKSPTDHTARSINMPYLWRASNYMSSRVISCSMRGSTPLPPSTHTLPRVKKITNWNHTVFHWSTWALNLRCVSFYAGFLKLRFPYSDVHVFDAYVSLLYISRTVRHLSQGVWKYAVRQNKGTTFLLWINVLIHTHCNLTKFSILLFLMNIIINVTYLISGITLISTPFYAKSVM